MYSVAMTPKRRAWIAATSALLAAIALSACPSGGPDLGEPHDPASLCEDSFRESIEQLQLSVNRDVDILFVIDNSGSMAEEQARLAASAGPLFERLDALDANYRIAFTTTDNGNPWCPPGQTTPEGGSLVLSSCTERLGDFIFDGGMIDAQDLACNDLCTLDSGALSISPTTTDVDPQAQPRPWFERREGLSNLPAGTDPAAAFACFAPQGINGCGFESQLESLYLALIRAQDSNQDSYGFLRASSVLAVVVLSDEADCSYNKDFAEIFDADGSKAFWSDPEAAFPSSAVCWNAGVACEGDPSAYDSCEPANYDLTGAGASDADAVLHPLPRYAGLLDGLEDEKQQLNPDQQLIVSVIAGVEGGGADWSVSYADAADPEHQLAYGIGPGCVDPNGDPAVPPVRMRALAESCAFGGQPAALHSVCADDYSAALADLGERIAAQMPPACFSKCVADTELSTPQLEPDCVVEQDPPGNDNTERVESCPRDEQGQYLIDPETDDYQLPEGVDVCYAALIDPDGAQTLDPRDDMSAACSDQGYNLEFALVRRDGVPVPGGTSISVECELDDCPELNCPNIGGG